MAKEFYIVQVDRPDDFTVEEMREYIQDAVSTWSGGYPPDHPLFGHFDGYGKAVRAWRMGTNVKYNVEVKFGRRHGQTPIPVLKKEAH